METVGRDRERLEAGCLLFSLIIWFRYNQMGSRPVLYTMDRNVYIIALMLTSAFHFTNFGGLAKGPLIHFPDNFPFPYFLY